MIEQAELEDRLQLEKEGKIDLRDFSDTDDKQDDAEVDIYPFSFMPEGFDITRACQVCFCDANLCEMFGCEDRTPLMRLLHRLAQPLPVS